MAQQARAVSIGCKESQGPMGFLWHSNFAFCCHCDCRVRLCTATEPTGPSIGRRDGIETLICPISLATKIDLFPPLHNP